MEVVRYERTYRVSHSCSGGRAKRRFAMTATGLDVFDTTIQKTNSWLDEQS